MEVLRHMFPNRISRNDVIPWLEKSPILVHVTSLCGVISKVKCTPAVLTMSLLKQPNEEETQNIPDDMLRKVMADVRDRVDEWTSA
jgi:hypothetical protein